jgi:hypothetical protein
MQISAQQAIVKTAQVEIKTLSVSGKQVTLAVFRQLDKREIIDYQTQKLNGIAWGRLNYHPDKCADSREHIHIVWQKDEFLYRDSISTAEDALFVKEKTFEFKQKAQYLKFVENARRWENFSSGDTKELIDANSDYWSSYKSDFERQYKLDREKYWKWIEYLDEECNPPQERVTADNKSIKDWLEIEFHNLRSLYLNSQEMLRFHQNIYQNLSKLDLLFIAV